jgi:hypothetical protein
MDGRDGVAGIDPDDIGIHAGPGGVGRRNPQWRNAVGGEEVEVAAVVEIDDDRDRAARESPAGMDAYGAVGIPVAEICDVTG